MYLPIYICLCILHLVSGHQSVYLRHVAYVELPAHEARYCLQTREASDVSVQFVLCIWIYTHTTQPGHTD